MGDRRTNFSKPAFASQAAKSRLLVLGTLLLPLFGTAAAVLAFAFDESLDESWMVHGTHLLGALVILPLSLALSILYAIKAKQAGALSKPAFFLLLLIMGAPLAMMIGLLCYPVSEEAAIALPEVTTENASTQN